MTIAPTFTPSDTPFADALHIFVINAESRQFTPKTVLFYRTTLAPFFAWAEQHGANSLREVKPQLIHEYLISLRDRGLASATQHTHARALKAFFNFCVREELLFTSPFTKITMPKIDKKLPTVLSDAEIRALLRACRTLRESALLLLLLDTGLRAAECTRLDWGHFEAATGRVQVVKGKQRKDRVVFVGAETRKALVKLRVKQRKPGPEVPIFRSERAGERLTVNGLEQLLRRIGKRAQVKCAPHLLRRTFAMRSLRAGMDIYTLAAVMGHSDIEVLRHYLAIVEQDVQQASAKYGVVDNLKP
jgi:integrase/recombinase XerD